jgi:branched-subunit amino acid transport protein AzlD
MTTASVFADFYNRIAEHELQGLYLVLIGFLLSFAFIRMSTRLMRSPKVPWWPGSIVSDSGVHLHHLVFGIVTMMVAGAGGFAAFGNSPWTEICAFAFGVGAGLTIDEFALWVYLDDVYWAKEGRSSIDATVIAAALMLLALLGFTPFTIEDGSIEQILGTALSALVVFLLVAICFGKGRILHGAIGFFIFPIALYGACRLGKPHSAWARRRYGERRPKKQARAAERFPPDRRTERFKNAFRDTIGGKPSEGLAAAKEEAFAATREASEEVRERAERITHPGDRGDDD